MTIHQRVDAIEHAMAQLEDVCWLAQGVPSAVGKYVDVLLDISQQQEAVVGLCCAQVPTDHRSAVAALRAGSCFFDACRNEEDLKHFAAALSVRTRWMPRTERFCYWGARDLSIAEVWLNQSGRKPCRTLVGTPAADFAVDAEALMELGVEVQAAARWLSASHRVNSASVPMYLRQMKTQSTGLPADRRWESSDYLNLRKAVLQLFLDDALLNRNEVRLTSEAIAEAVLTVAVVCTRTRFWRVRRSFGKWFSLVEKIVAQKV